MAGAATVVTMHDGAVGLQELLCTSDMAVVTAPLTAEMVGMIGTEQIASMLRGA